MSATRSVCIFLLSGWERRACLSELTGAQSPQDPLGLWLVESSGPCCQPGFEENPAGREGGKGGRVDANGSPVSSGPTGASALGPCGVQFMLTGAGLLRTFWELELLKEVRKSGEKFPVHGC